ncbi:MAG: hypothetical protein WCG14_03125 [Chlamydiia bacterium]
MLLIGYGSLLILTKLSSKHDQNLTSHEMYYMMQISPEELSPIDKIGATLPINNSNTLASSSQAFTSYMQNVSAADTGVGKAQMITPFELAGQTPKTGMATPSLATITAQAQMAQNTLNNLQTQIEQNPDLKLKSSQKHVLNNKLEDATAHIQAAGSKLGAPPTESATPEKAPGGPLGKFLSYVTNGMEQMDGVQKQLTSISAKGTQLGAADLLLIQVKMNKAQQELDFTSVMLSKAVEDFKTLMNIQL